MRFKKLSTGACLLCLLAAGIWWIQSDRPPKVDGVLFNDFEVKNFLLKSQHGEGDASYCLYLNYAERDDRKARYWLKKAAEQGNADGQYDYWNVTRNAEWLKKAANQGQPWAEARLGDYWLEKGQRTRAEYWYKQSSYQGNWSAALSLSELLERDRNDRTSLLESYAWATVGVNLSSPASSSAAKYFDDRYRAVLRKTEGQGWDRDKFIDEAANEAQVKLKEIRSILVPTRLKCIEIGEKR